MRKRLFEEEEIREALKSKSVSLELECSASREIPAEVRIAPQSKFAGVWPVWYGAFLKTVVVVLSDEEISWLAEGQFQVDRFLSRCAKEGGGSRRVWAEEEQ